MLSFNDLQEKKTKIKINPLKKEVMESPNSSSNCGEDCDCKKCEKKRRKEELGDETDVSTEETAMLTFKQYVSEEGADSLKDRRMERGGVGGNQRYDRPVNNTPNTFGKKKPKYDGMSALDKVKAQIRAKHGQGAIIDTKKKG